MGAPAPEMVSVEELTTEGLLGALRTISAPERRKHASVYNYWLSIKRGREFPPIRDLDPLEISDAGPFSLLLEMIGGGEDAEIRHIGQEIKGGITAQKVGDAPNPSLLSCIATRLPVVAGCRDAFAFEDEFDGPEGKTRCWVTLLPFSATGTWIDYVYGFVSLDRGTAAAGHAPEANNEAETEITQLTEDFGEDGSYLLESASEEFIDDAVAEVELTDEIPEVREIEAAPGPVTEYLQDEEMVEPAESETEAPSASRSGKVGFSTKFFETLANVGGFYGRPAEVELDPATASLESWEAEVVPLSPAISTDEPISEDEPTPEIEPNPVVEEAPKTESAFEVEPTSYHQTKPMAEGTLDNKLTDVRAKADEARQAKLRANVALYEGLSAAYDFALDAEDSPEEYLRLLEAEGLKIQLRSPMKPVVKLAFNGMCDDSTIQQLEAVLAWAFDEELPRGTLAERIESEGGIGPILNGLARAA